MGTGAPSVTTSAFLAPARSIIVADATHNLPRGVDSRQQARYVHRAPASGNEPVVLSMFSALVCLGGLAIAILFTSAVCMSTQGSRQQAARSFRGERTFLDTMPKDLESYSGPGGTATTGMSRKRHIQGPVYEFRSL